MNKLHFWARALTIFTLGMLISTLGWTQLYTGSVTGLVSDPSGAVVPNAQVRLVDEGKGFAFTATSDSGGRYVFRQVPNGAYKISVEAQGFRAETQSGVKVDVSQNVTVNFSLQVGATTQTVEISEAAPLLSTQDAVTGQTVDRKFINDLPLISRSVTDLAFLTPGITEVDTNCMGCTANNFISNGGRNATADMLLDGVTVTNFEQNSGIQVPTYTPSVDAVEEFTVQQTNFSAEYGFSGGTIVNMVTRAGTNQFHGSLYEFFRNQKLDANNWFNNEGGVPIAPLRNNNFGGTVGGPIKKDKTFFFFDYDGSRSRTAGGLVAGVPSAAERTGNFGELCGYSGGTFDSSGRCSADGGQLWDPYTGVYSASAGGPVRSTFVPFNNLATYMSPGSPKLNGTAFQLPARPGNLIDPVSLEYFQLYPLPNFGVGSSAYDPYNNFITSGSNIGTNNQYDIKIDHRWSDSNLTSVKYSRQGGYSHGLNCYGNVADPCSSGPNTGTAHLAAVNHTHTFSPTVLLNVSWGFTRGAVWTHSIAGDYKNFDPVKELPGLPQYMDTSGVPFMPSISLNSSYGQGSDSIGTQPWSYLRQGQETHHLLGTVSWVKGAHEIKFGAEGRMHRDNFTQPGIPGGQFVYDFNGTSQQPYSGGGDPLASFLVGNAGPGVGSSGYEVPNLVSTQSFQWGGFVQDTWKVGKKLTVNVGIRYDLDLPRTERYNRDNGLSLSVASPVTVPGLGTLHGGEIFASPSNRTPQYNTSYVLFGPRLGIAYRPIEKTVIRTGFGIYYSSVRSGAAGVGPPGYQGYDEYTPWITTYQNDGVTPYGRLSNPFPAGIKLPPGSSLGLLNDIGFGAVGPIPSIDSAVPYEESWSFGIQRELPANFLIDANYIGKAGHHLYFAGAGGFNYLGKQIEQYNLTQITALNTYVNNPFAGVITDPNSSIGSASPQVQSSQLQVPFPQFTGFSGDSPPWANSIYNSLQLRVEKRFSHGLQALVTYTYSKSLDDASSTDGSVTWLGGISNGPQDPNNRHLERGLSTFDIPQVLQFSYVYELPVGRGKALLGNANPVVQAVLGGWQINGIWRFTDGRPILLGLSGGQPLPTYPYQRPNLSGSLKCNTGSDFLTNYFANPGVLSVPNPFTVGNAPRADGTCRQPGQANATLSMFKEFSLARIREGARVEFRFEAFNALNHPQFSGPHSAFNSQDFGTITSTANSPREVQLALKAYF